MKETVDDEVLCLIGEKYQKSLISLELRACQKVGDAGVIGMCERLSGIFELRKLTNIAEGKDENYEPQTEFERYQIFYKN